MRSCSQPPTPAIAPRGEPAGLRRGVELEVDRDQRAALAVEPAQQRREVGDVGREVAQARARPAPRRARPASCSSAQASAGRWSRAGRRRRRGRSTVERRDPRSQHAPRCASDCVRSSPLARARHADVADRRGAPAGRAPRTAARRRPARRPRARVRDPSRTRRRSRRPRRRAPRSTAVRRACTATTPSAGTTTANGCRLEPNPPTDAGASCHPSCGCPPIFAGTASRNHPRSDCLHSRTSGDVSLQRGASG